MKLIIASLTHNDKSKGWLKTWLETNSKYADHWVIVDDASDDDSLKVMENFAKDNDDIIKFHISQMPEPTFKTNENKIRETLWNKVSEVAEEGDLILVLDSDELLTEDFVNFKTMVNSIGCTNPQFIFKKIEMWDEESYRIDGLWSNYFTRGFIYKKREWGYSGEGFHYPQIPHYAYNSGEVVNTDLRVKHLAYSTEELRKGKFDFMMNNPQQKKDITYHHLQTTLDKNPTLKKFKQIIDWPTLNLVIVCSNLYKLERQTIKTLNEHNYGGEINVHFLISHSNQKLINQVMAMDLDVNKFVVDVKNFEEDYKNSFQNREAILKGVFVDKTEFAFDEITIFIDGQKPITPALLKHLATIEKSAMIERNFFNVFAATGDVFNKMKEANIHRFQSTKEPFNTVVARKLIGEGINIWGYGSGAPFPIN